MRYYTPRDNVVVSWGILLPEIATGLLSPRNDVVNVCNDGLRKARHCEKNVVFRGDLLSQTVIARFYEVKSWRSCEVKNWKRLLRRFTPRNDVA